MSVCWLGTCQRGAHIGGKVSFSQFSYVVFFKAFHICVSHLREREREEWEYVLTLWMINCKWECMKPSRTNRWMSILVFHSLGFYQHLDKQSSNNTSSQSPISFSLMSLLFFPRRIQKNKKKKKKQWKEKPKERLLTNIQTGECAEHLCHCVNTSLHVILFFLFVFSLFAIHRSTSSGVIPVQAAANYVGEGWGKRYLDRKTLLFLKRQTRQREGTEVNVTN